MTRRWAVRNLSRTGLPMAALLLGGFAIAPAAAPNASPAPAAATPRAANLQISKAVSPNPVIIGGEAVYVVTVTNTGDAPATGVTMTDDLDPNVTPGSPGTGCSAAGQVVTCGGSGATIPAGGSQDFTIPVTVRPDLSDGTNIVNRAAVTADNASGASTQLISQAQTSTDVEINKTGPAVVNPDGTITYDIVVTNHGPSNAVDVTVQDPTNGQLTTITGLPAECPPSGLTVSCRLGTLGPGETRDLTVTLKVNGDVPPGTEIPNCATVYTGSRETTTSNNESCTTTAVGPDVPTTTTEPPTSSSESPTSSTESPTSSTEQPPTTSESPTSSGELPTSSGELPTTTLPGTSEPETTTTGAGAPMPSNSGPPPNAGGGQGPDGSLALTGSPTGVITLLGLASLLVGLVLYRLARKPG